MPRPGRMVSAAAFAALILLSAGNPALLLASDSDSRLVRANQLDDEAHQLLEKDQFEAAIERMRDALVLREEVLGAESEEVCATLDHLALIHEIKGDLPTAIDVYRQALKIAEKVGGADGALLATALDHLATALNDSGAKGGAETLWRRATAIEGQDPARLAEMLENLAEIAVSRADLPEADALLTRAVAVLDVPAPNQQALARALRLLALIQAKEGLAAKAIAHTDRALLLMRSNPEDDKTLNVSLKVCALTYATAGDFVRAADLYRRALEVLERISGSDHPDLLPALEGLADALVHREQFEEAERHFERALRIQEKASGPNSLAVAKQLTRIAYCAQWRGTYSRARDLLERALAIQKAQLPPTDPALASTLHNLGSAWKDLGETDSAETRLREALAIRRASESPDGLAVAVELAALGELYSETEGHAKAEEAYLAVLEIRKKALPPDHAAIGDALNDLAAHYVRRGDYARAKPLAIQALGIRERAPGVSAHDLAQSHTNLGLIEKEQGNFSEAATHYGKAMHIIEKTYGDSSPQLLPHLNNTVTMLGEAGGPDEAEPYLARALEIAKATYGEQHVKYAMQLNALGNFLLQKKDFANAAQAFELAAAIMDRRLQPHRLMSIVYDNLGLAQWRSGKPAAAAQAFARANETLERNVAATLALGSEQQKRVFLARTNQARVDALLSFQFNSAPNDAQATMNAVDTVIRYKGRLLDALASEMSTIRQTLDEEGRRLCDQLIAIRSQRAALALRAEEVSAPLANDVSSESLDSTLDQLEAALSSRSARFRAAAAPVDGNALRKVIPPGTAVVEFIRFHRWSRDFDSRTGEHHYAAYVLFHDSPPVSVDLGDAQLIDELADQFRGTVAWQNTAWRKVARTLDELVLRPVRKLIGDRTRLYLSPDGELNVVPFAALVDEKGSLLIEHYQLTYLTSARDLLRLPAIEPSRAPALLIGASSFSAFSPLPGAKNEVTEISKLLPGARLLTGVAATKEEVIRSSRPSILHIATHGLFKTSAAATQIPTGRSAQPLMKHTAGVAFADAAADETSEMNPLLLSRLVFSEAKDEADAGAVLTGLEMAGLDLWGTQLVVLSACSSGRGKHRDGDGVYGLRRALIIAGARTQIVTLWAIPDATTNVLMQDFYRRLLRGEECAEALRRAQRQVLADPSTAHPRYWAAFILGGDPGPLAVAAQGAAGSAAGYQSPATDERASADAHATLAHRGPLDN